MRDHLFIFHVDLRYEIIIIYYLFNTGTGSSISEPRTVPPLRSTALKEAECYET